MAASARCCPERASECTRPARLKRSTVCGLRKERSPKSSAGSMALPCGRTSSARGSGARQPPQFPPADSSKSSAESAFRQLSRRSCARYASPSPSASSRYSGPSAVLFRRALCQTSRSAQYLPRSETPGFTLPTVGYRRMRARSVSPATGLPACAMSLFCSVRLTSPGTGEASSSTMRPG